MARPFSSDAAGDGICGRESSSTRRRDLSRPEVIPQVCEQARERSRSEYRNDILNKRKTRKKCAALSFDRSTGTGTCTRYTSWVETTGTGTARDCKLGTSGIRRHPAMKSGPRDYESHLT
jgi:hypothetical protein